MKIILNFVICLLLVIQPVLAFCHSHLYLGTYDKEIEVINGQIDVVYTLKSEDSVSLSKLIFLNLPDGWTYESSIDAGEFLVTNNEFKVSFYYPQNDLPYYPEEIVLDLL